MPIRKVFESSVPTYRVHAPTGYDRWASNPDFRNRIFDEAIHWVVGAVIMENRASPTDQELWAFCATKTRWGGGADSVIMKFHSTTGAFLGYDGRAPSLFIGGICNGANGTFWAIGTGFVPNGRYYKFDPNTVTWVEKHPWMYYEGLSHFAFISGAGFCVDEDEDIALFYNGGPNASDGKIAVHRESTGAFLYSVNVCGPVVGLFMTDDRRAYSISEQGVMTLFEYTTGRVLNRLHYDLPTYPRKWAWDRTMKRILSFEHRPDTLPDGNCNARFVGHYPTPLPAYLTAPVPLSPPQVGTRTEVISRAYGGAGEGIPGRVLTFSLDTPESATLAPVQQTTTDNGIARTYLTPTAAGLNTINVSVEI